MDDVERSVAERACERLVYEYCHLIDLGTADRVHELFTDDGVWEAGRIVMTGIEEIREGFGRRAEMSRTSRHVCTNVVINVLSEDSAEGVSYVTLYRHDGEGDGPAPTNDQPVMVGHYADRFARTEDGWRIAHRRAEIAFMRAQ
jgi:ketosteroid isomerase-like protein